MFGIGMSEMLIIGIIALIFIGPDQIPETARTIARFLNELKRSTDGLKSHLTNEVRFPRTLDEYVQASNKDNHTEHVENYEADHSQPSPDLNAGETALSSEETSSSPLPLGQGNEKKES